MKRSVLLFATIWGGLAGLDRGCGFDAAYDAGYGAITLGAALIAGTFGWLWRIRATPMALGMAFSWSGCSGLVGYWWVFAQIGRGPEAGVEHQLLWAFLALYLAGAVSHLRVIAGAVEGGRALFWAATLGVLVMALGTALLVT